MDMCYDGALVMPSNYAVMNEDEMTYVDGGAWSVKRLWNNLVGLAGHYSLAKSIMQRVTIKGKSVWSWARSAVSWTQSYAKTALAAFCAKIGVQMSTVSRLVGVIVGVSTAAAVAYLGNKRVFY